MHTIRTSRARKRTGEGQRGLVCLGAGVVRRRPAGQRAQVADQREGRGGGLDAACGEQRQRLPRAWRQVEVVQANLSARPLLLVRNMLTCPEQHEADFRKAQLHAESCRVTMLPEAALLKPLYQAISIKPSGHDNNRSPAPLQHTDRSKLSGRQAP